mmetsp:Transcript_26918/g.68529  ORF Transcript_26918/g.68529 Transcript_26918/m.68529 type:complete len:202 (+) Transcript_26918:1289-1894(+)
MCPVGLSLYDTVAARTTLGAVEPSLAWQPVRTCGSCSLAALAADAAGALAPLLQLHHLQAVHVRVTEEHCRAAAHAHGVLDACSLQLLHQGLDVGHAHTEVAVTAAVLGAASEGVRVGQLHEVDHLRADPQPLATVRQLVVRAVRVDLQAQNALVKLQRALQVGNQQGHMVHTMILQPALSGCIRGALQSSGIEARELVLG